MSPTTGRRQSRGLLGGVLAASALLLAAGFFVSSLISFSRSTSVLSWPYAAQYRETLIFRGGIVGLLLAILMFVFFWYRPRDAAKDEGPRIRFSETGLWGAASLGILALSLAATLFVADYVEERTEEKVVSRISEAADHMAEQIGHGMGLYVGTLRGLRSFFWASNDVTPEEFSKYLRSLEAERRYSGVVCYRHIVRVNPGEEEAFVRVLQSRAGDAPARLWPQSVSGDVWAVALVEPPDQRDFGFNPASDPKRASAMARARDTGKEALTGFLDTPFDSLRGTQFAVYLPLYRERETPASEEARREAITGFLSLNYDINRVFFRIIETEGVKIPPGMSVSIYDVSGGGRTLVYSRPAQRSGPYVVERRFPVGDRVWAVQVESPAEPLVGKFAHNLPSVVFAQGIVMSFLLFGFFYMLSFSRAQAVRIAKEHGEGLHRAKAGQKAILDNISEMAWLKDTDSRFLAANQQVADAAGLTPEEVVGRTDADLWPEDLAARYRRDDEEVLATGRIKRIEEEFVDRQGRRRWIETVKTPIRDANGRVVGTAGIARDISERRKMEEERARLAAIVESSADAIIGVSMEGLITSWNDGARDLYGYDAEEVTGKPVSLLTPEGKSDETVDILQRISHGYRLRNFETVRRRKDGSRVDVSLTVSPIKNASGTVIGAAKIARDISDRKTTETSLRRSRAMLADAQRIAGLGTWVWNVVSRELEWSDEEYRIFGRDRATFQLSYESFLSCVHPDDRPAIAEAVRRMVRDGAPYNADHRILLPDGSERIVKEQAEVEFSPDGAPLIFRGTTQDITERKRAEEAVLAAKQNYESIINGTPALIGGVSSDGTTLFVNPAVEKTTGYQADELVGKNWWRILYPGEAYGQVDALLEALRKGSAHDYEMTLTSKSGQTRTVVWNFILRRAEDGVIREIVGFGMDITDRKKLERQLLHAQKMETIGTLAGGIAHDFNNQLTPVLGYLDFLKSVFPEGTEYHTAISQAKTCATSCAEIVKKLMNFSRASSERKWPIDPARLIGDFMPLLRRVLPSTIETAVTVGEDLWTVNANENELQTVLMNLCTNARDAMPSGGRLSLDLANVTLDAPGTGAGRPAGPHVVLTVRDTGSGISPDDLQKIFEPFFTTKPKGRGTGLGLPMVFGIIRNHGGWIDVSSRVGEGSSFQIYLPAMPNETAAPRPSVSPETLPRGSETVLFADDEEPVRNLARLFLERLGYKVLLAADGKEAVETFRKNRDAIGAVVLDMTMPGMTGRQAMTVILSIAPGMPVVLASGFTSEGDPSDFIKEGAAGFLAKPFTIQPLARALRAALDARP